LGELRAAQQRITELTWQIFILKQSLEHQKVPDDIKARRLTKFVKLVKHARSVGHKRIDIPWEAMAETIAEGLEDFPSSKPRGRPSLGEEDHCKILCAILLLDGEDQSSRSKIAMLLFGTLKTKSDSWRYEKVRRAIKFAETRRFARLHPKLKSALEDILAKLPKAPR
jgi:hypothetical protein